MIRRANMPLAQLGLIELVTVRGIEPREAPYTHSLDDGMEMRR
jgi:hypothetical protein